MFKPIYEITTKLANTLIKLEALKIEIKNLPISPKLLSSLRETAKLTSTHFSTMIEGNLLSLQEVSKVINESIHIKTKERDEKEVLGYYAALKYMETLAKENKNLTEKDIQIIHALVMSDGKKKVTPTKYRDGQNVIREGVSKKIVYLPPEAQDVPFLMKDLVEWINQSLNILPCPIITAIAHYQYATIHPYYDGNGRTARLLATLILHKCGYGLKGIYSLDEYYAKKINDYYEALAVGPSHNYYLGRAEADITHWIEYFCIGMLDSFEKVKFKALQSQKKGLKDLSIELSNLDPRQRVALTLFEKANFITSKDIELLFNIKSRTARFLCKQWVESGFLEIFDSSKKIRKYTLADYYKSFLSK